jgi:AraC-like DNA-binding protein
MVARIPPSAVRCEVLYVQRGTSPAGHEFASHAHPFWQVEIAQAGAFRCRTGGEEVHLRPGDGLLIPGGLEHGFRYDRSSRHVSLKVRVDGVASPSRVLVLSDLPTWPALRDAVVSLVDHDRPDRARQHATGHVLEAIIALAVAPRAEHEEPPSIVEQVRALVEHGEHRRWSVSAVARALGLSPGHASAVFRAQAAMTLKSFLDQARREAAAQLLAETNHSISEIADLLEFPDVFAFSRFVKRVAGVSPRSLRRKLAAPTAAR